jgi:hypothetical protein
MEAAFVAGVLAHGNGTKAATDAGYSARSARAKAVELSKRPRIAAAIEAGRKQVIRKFALSGERVMKEMCAIAFSDIRHYEFDDDGNVTLAAGAPDSAMRAVKKLKRKVRWIPNGDDAPIKGSRDRDRAVEQGRRAHRARPHALPEALHRGRARRRLQGAWRGDAAG